MFDVYVMLGFGVLGYALRRMKYPVAPLVLGMVLGDLMEKGLRRGLVLSDGELMPFFTRPISAAIQAGGTPANMARHTFQASGVGATGAGPEDEWRRVEEEAPPGDHRVELVGQEPDLADGEARRQQG